MDWRWRGRSARPSLQRTSKASTKGAVKEAAMVKLPLLCSELVLQAMKVIFSGRQGKSADGWSSSLAQKSVGTYNWLMHIPRLSQHGSGRGAGREQKKKERKHLGSPETHLTVYIRAGPTPSPASTSWMQMCRPHRLPTATRICFLLLSALLISHLLTRLSGGRKTHSILSVSAVHSAVNGFLKGFHNILFCVCVCFFSSTTFVSLGGKRKVSNCGL